MDKITLINSIKESMTCNWDILCSYDEEKINHILADKFKNQSSHMITSLKFSKEVTNRIRKTIERYDLTINLCEPKLEFISGERNIVQVDMDIASGICKMSEKKNTETEFKEVGEETISEKEAILRVFVPLNATTGDGIYIDEKGNINFVDKDKTSKIYLHFKHNELTTFKLIPYSKEVEETSILFNPEIKSGIIEGLINVFLNQVDEIQYEIGAISNTSQNLNELIPKSFIFSAYKCNDSKKGCLNIYIQVANSSSPTGNPTPAFLINGNTEFPFPNSKDETKKYTASLYLKKELLLNTMIKPFLPEKITASYGVDSSKRLLLEFIMDKKITIPKITDIPGVTIRKSEDMIIDFKEAPIQFLFDGTKAIISWKHSYKSHFEGKIGFGMSRMHISETATVDISYKDELDISDYESLALSFNMGTSSKYTTKISVKTGGFPGLFTKDGEKSDLQKHIEKYIPFDASDIKLDISPIGMLIVANILVPGKHIFKFERQEGIYAPYDIILFGNVADSVD